MDTLRFACPECGPSLQPFESAETLETHIAGDHLDLAPYECERCRFAKFATEFALIDHCRKDHGLTEFHIRFKFSEDLERKRAELRRRMRGILGPVIARCAVVNPTSTSGEDRKPDVALTEKFALGGPSISCSDLLQSANDCGRPSSEGSSQSPDDNEQSMISNLFNESDSRNDSVACQLCGLTVSNQRSSHVYHTNTKHSLLNLFECKCCQKKWHTIAKADVLKHIRAVHHGGEELLVDNRKKLMLEMRAWTLKCFPKAITSLNRPSQFSPEFQIASSSILDGDSSPTLHDGEFGYMSLEEVMRSAKCELNGSDN